MRRLASLLTATVFLTSGLLVWHASPRAAAEPTPGLGCVPSQLGAPVARIVPEPEYALDYISFDEWRGCLQLLNRSAPEYVEIKEIAKSPGWPMAAGGRLQSPVYLVEVTNEASPVPFEAKIKNLFVLSIHGNEKGGREGGFRAIEDLARNIGIAQEYPKMREWLDYMVAVFVFPNPDGWTHEELAAFVGSASAAGGFNTAGGFTRGNANGFDLNRQWPNQGWNRESYRAMGQPEIIAAALTLKGYTNWGYGTDIHGMLNPADANLDDYRRVGEGQAPRPGGSLLMGMLSAGQSDPLKMLKTTRLAELLKERVNRDPSFVEWSTLPDSGLWGGRVMEWGTSWDTIGYVDSGFTGDFIFQNDGLNAGDIDFELSYNHVVTDNHYAGLGMELNRLHVRAVRQVIAVFMEAAAADVQVSYETNGTRTAYLVNPKVITNRNANGTLEPLGGWAEQNANDDAFDYHHVDYRASPNDYFAQLAPFVRRGDRPGSLDGLQARDVTPEKLALYENLVISGSAIEQIEGNGAVLKAVQDWVQQGGNLVLTDQSLRVLSLQGIIPGEKIKSVAAYAGYVTFLDKASPLAAGLRGLARQTYEAVPLGYEPGRAPIWYVEPEAWKAVGGKAIGAVELPGSGPAANPLVPVSQPPTGINLGELSLGAGTVRILGALLPDPTEEYYHPYGLDSYATTYTGNLLFRNLLGWEEVYEAPPVVAGNLGQARPILSVGATGDASAREAGGDTPAPSLLAVLLLLGGFAIVRARRRAE